MGGPDLRKLEGKKEEEEAGKEKKTMKKQEEEGSLMCAVTHEHQSHPAQPRGG